MNRAGRIDATIQALLPLETYRSPWVPTRRLGVDGLVAVAAPFRQVSAVSVAPSTWFAVAPDFSMLLAFARTSVVTPVSDFQAAPAETRSPALSAKEGHAALWRLADSMWPDFFRGRAPMPGVRLEVADAIDATVPGRLQPWVRLCCSDFFEWLEQDTAAAASA